MYFNIFHRLVVRTTGVSLFLGKNENQFRWNVLRIFMLLTDKQVIFIRCNNVFSNHCERYVLLSFIFLPFLILFILFIFIYFLFLRHPFLSSNFFHFLFIEKKKKTNKSKKKNKLYFTTCTFLCALDSLSIFRFDVSSLRDRSRSSKNFILTAIYQKLRTYKKIRKKVFRSTLYNYHNSL